jgi:hypothetical protein
MMSWSQVAGVFGSASCEGDDVVDGVCSRFAADVADGVAFEDAGVSCASGVAHDPFGHRPRAFLVLAALRAMALLPARVFPAFEILAALRLPSLPLSFS